MDSLIQIIEGNRNLRSLLAWHLQQANYHVCLSADQRSAKDIFYRRRPSLIILGSDLPDGNIMELCTWLSHHSSPLILMLSARSTENDVVSALKAGADDYLRKPFGMQEFLARVEALFRRLRCIIAPTILNFGSLQINLIQHQVKLKDKIIDLTPQEFNLLYILAGSGGNPLSRSDLLLRAWPDSINNPRTIDTHILSLRKKLDSNLIETVRSVGYRLKLEDLV